MNKKNKFIIVCLLLTIIMLNCGVAFASEGILEKAEGAKDELVSFLQDLAKIAAVVFIAWAGFIFWGAGGEPQKMAAAKSKLVYFFIALILVFGAEPIVNTVLGWFT